MGKLTTSVALLVAFLIIATLPTFKLYHEKTLDATVYSYDGKKVIVSEVYPTGAFVSSDKVVPYGTLVVKSNSKDPVTVSLFPEGGFRFSPTFSLLPGEKAEIVFTEPAEVLIDGHVAKQTGKTTLTVKLPTTSEERTFALVWAVFLISLLTLAVALEKAEIIDRWKVEGMLVAIATPFVLLLLISPAITNYNFDYGVKNGSLVVGMTFASPMKMADYTRFACSIKTTLSRTGTSRFTAWLVASS